MAQRITSAEAAKRLGVTRHRINAMIRAKRFPAEKVGMQYLIDVKHLAKVKDRKPGRPKKGK